MLNWKGSAVEMLSSYNARVQSLDSLDLQLQRLEQELLDVRKLRAEDDWALNNMVKRLELSQARRDAKLCIRLTENALGVLTSQEQQLLKQLYISPGWGNLRKLEEHTGMTRSTLYRKRDQALRKFTVALYGKV